MTRIIHMAAKSRWLFQRDRNRLRLDHGEGVVNPPGMDDAPNDSRKGSSGRTCILDN